MLKQHHDNTSTTLKQQLHSMVIYTNNCTAWWYTQTITQHGEIHKQLHNMVKFKNNCTPKQHHCNTPTTQIQYLNNTSWVQLHNIVKFRNNCTTWWNTQTIAQHVEMHKQLHYIVKYINNCTTWWNLQIICTTWQNSQTIQQHPTATVRTSVLVG